MVGIELEWEDYNKYENWRGNKENNGSSSFGFNNEVEQFYQLIVG